MISNGLPKEIDLLILEIESFINSCFKERTRTLPVKIQKREKNTIITWNIYSIDNIQLETLFESLVDIIEQNFSNIKGEILIYSLSEGKIIDTGVQEFNILKGKNWDIYLYDPEIFIYSRLLLESQVLNPQKRWISVDIDVIEDSAWF